jgi:glucose-1-phosphate thymidylyltransferase
MKALILSGGKGSRLRPLTFTTAKQLIPVANKPILGYVFENVARAKIQDVGVVIAPSTGEDVKKYVGDGSRWGVHVTYITQEPLGLAHAVKVAKDFLGNDSFIMCLGDNVIGKDFSTIVQKFEKENLDALILLKEVDDPSRFGIAQLDKHGRIIRLVEKPKTNMGNLAIVGTYLFSDKIHRAIERIKPSWRHELEITDATQEMVNAGATVKAEILDSWWLDTGKKDDILSANAKVLDEFVSRNVNGKLTNSRVQGRVTIEKGASIIDSTVRGPCIIGREARIENSLIGPYTSVGKGTTITNSSVEYCVIMEDVQINGIQRLEESLVGRNARILNNHGYKMMKLHVGDYSEVDV